MTNRRHARWIGRALTAALAAIAALSLAACGARSPSDIGAPRANAAPNSSARPVKGDVVVFAAASLTGAFTTLKRDFEVKYPQATVKLSFGASSTLAQSLIQGAPADVFASAAPVNMQQAQKAHTAKASSVFARNVMEIAVAPHTKTHITDLADLARPGVTVELCDKQVPCGAVALQALKNAGVTLVPKTYGADVKSVLTSVQLGEVDAGIVYVTDVKAAAGKVIGVPIPASQNASTSYLIAMTTNAPNRAGAKAFIAEVLSPQGRRVLTKAGFETP